MTEEQTGAAPAYPSVGHKGYLFNEASFVVIVTGMMLGMMWLNGQLVKPITNYYWTLHDGDNTQINVLEQHVVELGFMQFAILCLVGGAVLLFAAAMKTGGSSDKAQKATLMFIANIGFILWTAGYLVIGWEKPTFDVFASISLSLIPVGAGMYVWGSLPIFMRAVTDPNDGVMAGFLGLLAASSPTIYMMFFFPYLRENVADTNGAYFHVIYRNVAMFATPLLVLCTVTSVFTGKFGPVLSAVKMDAKGFAEDYRNPSVGNTIKEVGAVTPRLGRLGWENLPGAGSTMFIVAMTMFTMVFIFTWMLFESFIIHTNQAVTALVTINPTNVNLGFADEYYVVFVSVMLLAGGSLIGRSLALFALQFPMVESYPNMGSTMVCILMHLGSVVTTWMWHSIAVSGTENQDVTDTAVYVIAFFLGMFNGAVYFDVIYSSLAIFNQGSAGAKVGVDEESESAVKGNNGEAKLEENELASLSALAMYLVLTGSFLFMARFDLNFFGGITDTAVPTKGFVVGFPYATLVAAGINTTSLFFHAMARLAVMGCASGRWS